MTIPFLESTNPFLSESMNLSFRQRSQIYFVIFTSDTPKVSPLFYNLFLLAFPKLQEYLNVIRRTLPKFNRIKMLKISEELGFEVNFRDIFKVSWWHNQKEYSLKKVNINKAVVFI